MFETAAFADFTDICPEIIVWEQMSGRDSYGKPSYAAPIVFGPATSPFSGGRREYKAVRKTQGPGAGVEFIQGSVVYVLADVPIKNEDRVYVQGDPQPYPPILQVIRQPDESGNPYYTEVVLGSAKG